jgi:hypothetical protein
MAAGAVELSAAISIGLAVFKRQRRYKTLWLLAFDKHAQAEVVSQPFPGGDKQTLDYASIFGLPFMIHSN